MFFTFLNKEGSHTLDLSVLLKYRPQETLFYYYNSHINIPLEFYKAAREMNNSEIRSISPAGDWIRLIENTLKAREDIEIMAQNEYLSLTGPYYLLETNTRVYFPKETPDVANLITSQDLDLLTRLHVNPVLDKNLQAYHKNRKNNKKSARSLDELIKDIDMCLLSLTAIEDINRHVNYLNKFLENRYQIVESQQICPQEPDTLPEKPQPVEESNKKDNLLPFLKKNKKQTEQSTDRFHLERKVYYIRYREYEKACERYKEILQQWEIHQEALQDLCLHEIEDAESKLKHSYRAIEICNEIISNSLIHIDYQDTQTLQTFKRYLQTGRARDLQDCMNLYEEESYWQEIKASQERIENTIYFLQNNNHNAQFADEQFNLLFRETKEPDKLQEMTT